MLLDDECADASSEPARRLACHDAGHLAEDARIQGVGRRKGTGKVGVPAAPVFVS